MEREGVCAAVLLGAGVVGAGDPFGAAGAGVLAGGRAAAAGLGAVVTEWRGLGIMSSLAPRSNFPPEADMACKKCGLHQSWPVVSMHQFAGPSFMLQSRQRKHCS